MAAIDPAVARRHLDESLAHAEHAFAAGQRVVVNESFSVPCDVVFESRTSSYREVLPGLCIARLADAGIDLRLPYANQGETAFNARSLDTDVVNPFLHRHRLPAGKSPYLAVFRRQFRFTNENREQLRDKHGYDALLTCIHYLQGSSPDVAMQCLRYVLFSYVRLRESSDVAVSRLNRISLPQYRRLFNC